MKVKPNDSFVLLGTDIKLEKNKVYEAKVASNVQDYKELGWVFIDGLLLSKHEYEIVSE